MSLRRESIRAYRDLYSAAARAAQDCGLYNGPGLLQYVSQRYGKEADLHRRQLSQTLRRLERQCKSQPQKQKQNVSLEVTRPKILSQYQRYISSEIDRSRALTQALILAPDNAALTSVLQALSSGVGNTAYQQALEASFLSFLEFVEKQASRDEVADDATSERQNRIMLQALLPFAERLLLVHRTAIGEQNRASSLPYLTPWQVTEAIVGNRGGVSAVHLRVGRDHIVVEIDETYNKQVVYICCTRREGGDSGSYEWDQEVERVEISESEEVQKTLFHSAFLFAASRMCDTLLHESPLHPTRTTVVVGHAVGGAVGLILSLLLAQRGFEVANTVSLGAPKALQGTLERYITAVNPVRLVLAGDPLVELPVTGAEGAPFVHVGEILLLSPPGVTAEGAPTMPKETPSSSSKLSGARRVDEDAAPSSSSSSQNNDFAAEALNTMLMDEANLDNRSSLLSAEKAPGSSAEVGRVDDDSDEGDSAEMRNVAEERYRKQFLVEDYVHHMRNPLVELTYAEGDEVWDEGDYEATKRSKQTEPIVTAEEHRVRDLRGPL
ncbi:putative mitochondrial hypothetical protein [Leptomonas pyrrhocoris]|uniref:Fungal lipase-type domain-containing protein n=1 Tax=Leptomonas pyrrhocoris TaxID=157538 RepID=A0A0N0E091_LEPPY|nr:putative mitochondrial hypothetical protein [Leptomonas pyrrhocoris]KPA86172.1 putative mitochondrial hypothetical protein [Leptomonas pyrrhocoris]|eukprot:XP_015664611.1 putative mitochondrial hypothetical protein [Leptomonas pyrrhocoris]